MTPRDGFPRFSARSAWRGDAGHRKARATPSESLGKPPFRSRGRTAGGRRKALPISHIARGFPPTRRIAHAISRGHYQRSLVLASNSAQIWQAASHPESWNMRWCGRAPAGVGGGMWGAAEGMIPPRKTLESPCDPTWPRVLANSLSRFAVKYLPAGGTGTASPRTVFSAGAHPFGNPSWAGTQHCC
jgi:hypothetical protein